MKNKILKLTALLLFAVISLTSCGTVITDFGNYFEADKSDPTIINIEKLSLNDTRLRKEFVVGIVNPQTYRPNFNHMHYTEYQKSIYMACRGEKRMFDASDFGIYVYFGISEKGKKSLLKSIEEGYTHFAVEVVLSHGSPDRVSQRVINQRIELNEETVDAYGVQTQSLYNEGFVTSLESFEQSPMYIEIPKDLYSHEEGHTDTIYVELTVRSAGKDYVSGEKTQFFDYCEERCGVYLRYYVTDGKIIIFQYNESTMW